jgi:hypothetical protein
VPARIRRHPVLAAVLLVSTLGGAALGACYLPSEWTLLRRGLAGAVAGAGTGLLVTATRLYV